MKKISFFLFSAAICCLLAACGEVTGSNDCYEITFTKNGETVQTLNIWGNADQISAFTTAQAKEWGAEGTYVKTKTYYSDCGIDTPQCWTLTAKSKELSKDKQVSQTIEYWGTTKEVDALCLELKANWQAQGYSVTYIAEQNYKTQGSCKSEELN